MAPTPDTTDNSNKIKLKLTDKGRRIAQNKRSALGFDNQSGERLQAAAYTSEASLKRFWKHTAITADIFIAICEAINVDWRTVADLNIPNNLPDPYAKEFVGRSRDLVRLHNCLQDTSTLNMTCTSLLGMGGVGKTEMAIQYGKEYLNTYPGGICWVNVEPRFRVPEDISASAKAVGDILLFADSELGITPLGQDYSLEQQVNYCWQHWPKSAQKAADILIIFDNVNDYEEIHAFIPNSPRFRVLITSRKVLSNTVPTFDVDPLAPEAAYAMLKSLIGEERISEDNDIACRICEEVGCHPQAIRLVGDFLADVRGWTLKDMLDELQEKRLAAAALCDPNTKSAHRPLGLAAAFEISWAHLEKFEGAQRLACLLSLFAATKIEWSLVEKCLPDDSKRTLISLRDRQLVKFSLLRKNKDDSYQYHQLIKYFMERKLKVSPWVDEFIAALSNALFERVHAVVEDDTQASLTAVAKAIPHVDELGKIYEDRIPDEHVYSIYTVLGHVSESQGLFEDALDWRRRCLCSTKSRFGNIHLDIAKSLIYLGRTTSQIGEHSDAQSLLIEAYNMLKNCVDTNDVNIADVLNALGVNYNRQGNLVEAETVLKESLEIFKLAKDKKRDYKSALGNLGHTYLLQSRYKEAKEVLTQAHTITTEIFRKDSFEYAESLSELGILELHWEQYADSEPLLREAFDLKESILGRDHPSIAITLNNLASVCLKLNKYEEAEKAFLKSLDLRIRLYDEEHPKVARAYLNLGVCYRDQEKYEQAETAIVQAKLMNERLLGDTHLESVTCLYMLAGLYWRQNRFEESKDLFLKALELAPTAFGPKHSRTSQIHASLAKIYSDENLFIEAAYHLQQAHDIRKEVFGIDHKLTKETLESLNRIKVKHSESLEG